MPYSEQGDIRSPRESKYCHSKDDNIKKGDIMSDHFLICYAAFWLAVLGAALGSFFDCLAWRRAHGESIWQGRSHCGACGHVLGVRDLIPVFSYLFARGRCRYCRAKIPADALSAELAGMTAFGLLTWKTGLVPELAMWLILAALLLLLSLIDLHERLLPDKLLAAAAANRLIFLLLSGNVADQFAPMLIGALSVSVPMLLIALVMDRILGRESMGGGDIKLLFVLGLYLNWMQMLLLLFVACILGIAAALAIRGTSAPLQSDSTSDAPAPDDSRTDISGIPFGPCLAAAGLFVYLWGQPLINWYVGLLH